MRKPFFTFLFFFTVVATTLTLYWGCGNRTSSPVAPTPILSLNISVPYNQEIQSSLLGSTSDILLYKATTSGQAVTGSAGPFSDSSGSGNINFSLSLPSRGIWLLALELLASPSQAPLALGAAQFDTGALSGGVTLSLGSVSRNCYQTDTWMDPAGSWFSFTTDNLSTSNNGADINVQPAAGTGNGYQILTTSGRIQYMGNGPLVNFAAAPATESAISSAASKSSSGSAVTTLQLGDVYCVQLSSGGHAWMQINNPGTATTGPSFRFRVNTTLPYYAYERTSADNTGVCLTPLYTPSPTPSSTSTATSSPTITFTATTTPTSPNTATFTNTYTATASPTPTVTPTVTTTATITDTPQPGLALSWNDNPASQTYTWNQANVTGIQFVLTDQGQEPVSVSQIAFGLEGSIGSGEVVSGSVKLFPDNSTDDPSGTGLYVVSAPTPVALGTFTGGAVTVAGLTNLTLSPSAPETFLLVLSLNALGGGDFLNTVSPSGIIATGVNTHAPALVNGGPFNGNDQTVLAATATPSNTLTSTATSTDSATPTITLTPVFSYTVTSTPTSTETPLFTYTVTSTSTGTSTPSTTSTITSTDTTTWTSTPTETSTNSPTSTPTSTLSPTQTLTPEPTVYIPDPNLLNAVENLLFDNSVIPSTTSPIYPENMATITSLTVNSVGVTSLVGLEDCSAVTFIDLNSNSVTDLSPLSGLTGLTSLNLEFNRITDLSPVTGLSNLTSLDLYGNQISVLPNLTGLVSLTSLQLGYNLIVNISNLSVLTNLNYLVLDYNQITNVAPLASLANVQELFLYGNYIETIPDLTGMTSLTYLDLEYNYNPNDGNALMDISGLAGVTSLQNVYLNGNSISDVTALQYLTNLYYIDLDYNLITDLSPLLTNAAGNYWYGVYLSVMNEAFQNTPATYLTVQSEVLSLINNYSWQVNYQVDMPDQNLQNAIDQILFIDGGPVTPSNLQSINSLSFIAAGVTNIEGLEFCSAVTQIDLQWNAITDLTPLTNLTNITSLNMESNQVTDVTALSGLYWLTQLDLNNNQITNVSPLAALTNLQYLGLDDNTIYDISNWFNGYWVDTNNPFPYLIELELSGNQLTYLPTGFYLPSLTALYLEYDQIGDFQPLVDETQLETPVPPVMLNVTWDNFSNCSVQNEYNALINANWTLIGWQPCD